MKRADPRGIALPTVLLALVLLETLVAVAFMAALAGARSTRWGVADAVARGAREAGLARLWEAAWLPAWDTASVSVEVEAAGLPGGGVFVTSLVNLGPRVTALVAEGTSEGSDARALAAELGVRRPAAPALEAAFVSGGPIDVYGALVTRGQPGDSSEWAACSTPRAASPHIQLSGAEAVALFDSLPHRVWRPFALPVPGAINGVVMPGPVDLGGVCVVGIWTNWGDPLDPLAPCGARYSVVYYDGPLRIAGGRGQGTLVVTGDLTVGGGFVFHGLVAVRGRLLVEEPGFSVVGTLLVGEVLGQRHAVSGTLAVQYSKCLVEMGLPASGRPDRLPGPSWLELSEVP